MLILMLLTSAFTILAMLFIILCVGVIALAHGGHADDDAGPPPGIHGPRIGLRAFMMRISRRNSGHPKSA
jgi:hypothetical protein